MNKPFTSGRVTSWLHLLQEFNVTIIDRLEKSNVVVDYVSRLNNPSEEIPVNDDFPHEHIFVVSTNSPWFDDIANYLVIGKISHHLSTHEK